MTFRPGSGFKLKEKGPLLYLFERRELLILRPWLPRAWAAYDRDTPCVHAIPSIHLGDEIRRLRKLRRKDQVSERKRRRLINMSRFFEYVPLEVQDQLARPWPVHDWEMFAFFARVPGGLELAQQGDTALAYLLAHNRYYRSPENRRPHRAARAQMKHKRKKILGWLGLPAREAVVKMLRRIPVESTSLTTLRALRSATHNDVGFQHLCHQPVLSAGVVLLAALGDRVSPGLLTEVAKLKDTARAEALARRAHDAVRLHEQYRQGQALVLHSPEQIETVHDELSAHQWTTTLIQPVHRFAAPALLREPPKGLRFAPLLTPALMRAEGRAMNHCLGHYHHVQRAKAMVYFTYSIRGPARATLSVALNRNGVWRLEEIRGPHNDDVDLETRRLAQELVRCLKPRRGLRVANGLYDDDLPF